jgi:hypothetical protein
MFTPELFWSRVDVKSESECWPWRLRRDGNGYGLFDVGPKCQRKTRLTHRLAYELTNGKIDLGLQVCHSCDNPTCCNPKHLFLGTNADNMRDMRLKGRSVGRKQGRSGLPRSMNDDQVRHARRDFGNGVPISSIAEMLKIKPQIIRHVVLRHTYKNIA